ncbi:MAG: DUF4350 domain-containing protein [Spirosomaceae bacterium]|jgi:hypothetical protein|nr:DUF4350 domain-containing protein [Spirosomataceae bacterium]
MKSRILIFGALLVVIVALLVWVFGTNDSKPKKKFDKTFSVSSNSFKPYDTKFFYDEIKVYAGDGFRETYSPISELGFDSFDTNNNVYMVVSPYFYPNSSDINELKNFASYGNTVFISAYEISEEFLDSLYFTPRNEEYYPRFPPVLSDTRWKINWIENDTITQFGFPGHLPARMTIDSVYLLSNNAVSKIDTLITDDFNQIQMLEATCGEGKIFVCNNPILMSNYFLLHKNNYALFNKIAQKIELRSSHVLWDEYYRTIKKKRNPFERDRNEVLKVIMENPPLKWAFYTFLVGISLFILIYLRRIQKAVPIQKSLKNNSEEYINVVSGLYWQQQNHKSIGDKIIGQFFEYLMVHFHINAKEFTEGDLHKISQKTGHNIETIKAIFGDINFVKSSEEIDKQVLISLYQKINAFYKQEQNLA